MSKPVDASAYTDMTGLAALKRGARASDPDTLRQVAKQFESVFAKMMLSSMRQASMGDSIFDSEQTKFYQGMFDDQLAMELTKGKGLGLADMLVQQLQRQGLAPKDAADAKAGANGGTRGANASGSAEIAGSTSAAKTGLPDKAATQSFFPLGSRAPLSADAIPNASKLTKGSGSALVDDATGSGHTNRSAFGPLNGFASRDFADLGASGIVGALGAPTALAADEAGAPSAATSSPLAGSASITGAISRDTSSGTQSANGKQVSTGARTLTPEEFVEQLWPCAEAAGKELGVDPAHLLAQAALETGWGKSLPCDANGNTSFNFFGIKAGESWNGSSVNNKTLEVENGVAVQRQAKFRSYASAEDSFKDYVAVLRDNPRYANALNTGSDAKAFAQALQQGGYATDPAYAQKIAAIAQNLVNATGLKSSGSQPITYPHGPL